MRMQQRSQEHVGPIDEIIAAVAETFAMVAGRVGSGPVLGRHSRRLSRRSNETQATPLRMRRRRPPIVSGSPADSRRGCESDRARPPNSRRGPIRDRRLAERRRERCLHERRHRAHGGAGLASIDLVGNDSGTGALRSALFTKNIQVPGSAAARVAYKWRWPRDSRRVLGKKSRSLWKLRRWRRSDRHRGETNGVAGT